MAAQIDAITVTNRNDAYMIEFDAVIDAPAPQVFKVIGDFTRMGRISPEIIAGIVPGAGDCRSGSTLWHLTSEGMRTRQRGEREYFWNTL